jgi:hypothetical protein
VLEAYNNRTIPPSLNRCIIEVCKLSTKKGDSLTFNLSPKVIARRRGRRSSGRTDHEVPLDAEIRTETGEPLVQHDAAVQDSPLPGQRHNPRRRGREVMNMNNSHPHPAQVSSLPNQQRNRRRQNMNDSINGSTVIIAQSTAQLETQPEVRTETSEPLMQHDVAVQDSPLPGQRRNPRRRVREVMNMNNNHPHLAQVSSLPNQRRNRRQRNMNNPINGSTVITAQSTAQLETHLEVNNAERDQLKDDSPDLEPYHVQDPQLEIQTNANQEDSLQREGPTQINTQVLDDHENNFIAETIGAIISPHREGSVETNTQFDQFRQVGQPNFESEIGTNAQPIHAEDAPSRKRLVETNAQLVHENNFTAENIGANPEPEIQTNVENIAQEDSQQREGLVETNTQFVHKNNFNAENTGANPEPEIQTNAENIAQEDSQQMEGLQKILHKKIPNRGKGRLKQTLNLFIRIILI